MMPSIIGYAYEADIHCPDCAYQSYRHGNLKGEFPLGEPDEHGIPESGVVDLEGNEIGPIFDTDDVSEEERCGDCGCSLWR